MQCLKVLIFVEVPLQSLNDIIYQHGIFCDTCRRHARAANEGAVATESSEVADVVEHARIHGVRVMVEFDMPGHAAAWCTGYPDVCPSPTCLQPLNVANNNTFVMITQLLNEMTGGKPGAGQRNPPFQPLRICSRILLGCFVPSLLS